MTLSAGLAQDARADATVSPLHYQGVAPELAVSVVHRTKRWELSSTIDGGSTALSAPEPNAGSARLDHGALRLSALQAERRSAFTVGATLASQLDVTTMRYQDAQSTQSGFAFGYAALEPTARWRLAVVGGDATLEIATPIAALVDQPYSDLKTERSILGLRGATPRTFRGADAGLGVLIGSFSIGYRFSYVRYDDANPVRGVSQCISLGVRTRVGSRDTP